MEQRLIDANKLERWLKTNMANENPLHCDIKETYSECITMVHCMETIEAVPLVHARWVPNHGSYGTPHCSNCKWRIPYSEDSTLDARSFCPKCGAKMDAKEVES